ncbi:flagellar basal body P-ring formation chaperone FlgA [Helicobacter sp. MIT 21-1697]|uniref:flagellar basal body P-ring formation chaperone FlgA n=1 Tax=Helicobacter sp. MIT 21-1697 TaxID=2993733 RepID=UPI00224B8D77|nr:flagellar basal body P-ring formation chaperone FlgA [Helicobacter sp. MIT 21-1697]MCX2717858.1 flagellar basal body P-ring formation chaperone FlgA [Helicobacter sp. MIT 21-1697]
MKHFFLFLVILMSSINVSRAADDISIPSSKLFLQKSYQVNKSSIYSTDIFPQIDRRFKIATLPPDKFTLKLKSVDIKLIFARYGYEISSFESEFVEFNFISDMREDKALEFIQKMYIQHYGKTLEIKKLLVRPIGVLPQQYELLEYELAPPALKKNSGTFVMKYRTGEHSHIKKITFAYTLEGVLEVLKSTQNINVNDTLTPQNTRTERIAFERVGAEYMSAQELYNSGAKSYIRADTAITKDKIKPRIIVKKGEKIRVFSREGGIVTEIVLVARQNAVYNEIINAQNPNSGKIIRVKITDEGKGEIL